MENDIDIEETARNQVDVQFMSTIAEKMHVPRHIRLGNQTDSEVGSDDTLSLRGRPPPIVEAMTVPDRILIADPFPLAELDADNSLRNGRSSPTDRLVDNQSFSNMRNLPITLQTPPSTLTVRNGAFRTAAEELEDRQLQKVNRTIRDSVVMHDNEEKNDFFGGGGNIPSSIPGMLSAEQKVMLLDKQVARLNTRLYELEDTLESVQQWQKLMLYAGIVLTAVLAIKNILKS